MKNAVPAIKSIPVIENTIVAVVPVFILIDGALSGVHLWWIMYLYAWPLLVLIAWLLRKNTSSILWAIVSGIFGLCFG